MSRSELLLDAIQSLSAEASASLRERLSDELGLQPREASVLSLMWQDDGPVAISFRDIERRLKLSQSSASRAASSMAKQGLLTYAPDPSDARVKRVELTAKGRRLAQQVALARAQAADALAGVDRILAIARDEEDGLPDPEPIARNEDAGGVVAFGESWIRVAAEPVLVTDILYVRNALEPAILQEATRLRTDIDVAECRGLIGLMRDSMDDPRRFYRADWALHRRIVQVCQNDVLKSMYLALLSVLEKRMEEVVGTGDLGDYLRRRLVIHEELVEAMASGDSARMERAAKAHEFLGLAKAIDGVAPS